MKAYEFSLKDQHGRNHTLSEYQGKWIVLYFYPKDDTPGCTKEACSFRDNISNLTNKKVIVLGVSKDTVSAHEKFADKYHLNFPILSDPTLETIKAYAAWGKKKFLGREFEGTLRITYIINPQGEIVKKYDNVNPVNHAGQILKDVVKLQES